MSESKERENNAWMRVLGEGQHTRDAAHRTRGEIERDKATAEAVAARRKALFPNESRAKKTRTPSPARNKK